MDNAINGTVDDTSLLNNENDNVNNIDKTNNNSNWIWSDEKLSYYDQSSGWYYREDLGYFYFDENNECHYVYPAEASIKENEDTEKKNNDSESESELEEGEISEDDEEEENMTNNTNNTYLNKDSVYYNKNNNNNSDYYSNYNTMSMGMNMTNTTTTVNCGPTTFSNEIQLAYGIDNNNNIQSGVIANSTTTNPGTTQEYENEYLRLVVQSSDLYDKGSIVLVDTEGLSIGRDKSFEKRLRLPEMQVSKYHAKIYLEIEYQPTTTTNTTTTTTTTNIANSNNSKITSLPVENLATLQSKIIPIIPKVKPKKSRIKRKYEDLDNESSEEINYNYDMYNEDMYDDDDNDSIDSKDKKKDEHKNKNRNAKIDHNENDDRNTINNDNIKLSIDNSKMDTISKDNNNSSINSKIDKINNAKEEKNSLKDLKTQNDDIKKEEETNKNSSNENEKEKKSEIQNQQNIKDEVEKKNIEESEEGEIEEGEEGQIEEDIQIDKNKDTKEEKEKDDEEEEEEEGEITDDGEYGPMEEEKEIIEKENYKDNYITNNNDAMMNSYYSYPGNYSSVNYEPQPQYTCSYHFSIIDMGSTHGTFVNGVRLSESKICSKPCPLKNKDIIQIGSTILEVHYHKQWACSECTITEHQKEIPLLDKSMTTTAANSHGHSGYGPNGTTSVNGYDPHPVSLEEQRKNELKRLKNKYLPHHRKTKRMKYGYGEGEEGDDEGEDHGNPYIDRAAQRRELYSTNIPYFK
ncbi:hypothetical protein LY90DRAFT_697355 [Neocallimastix californiae]|uniref:FHA domain-containing protein n=1 Tax=Neocallimastix californiae TaxID=1754190 RepID=A0A1Y2FHJ8_9FUNG|nr:hypothetical protein LY90DRAFT_697355 [Neocallimastix californiae]|eukprot:ORY83438.1 hypothetical protein LY90DRAFT_697355 [Neocallimastix californiae]